MSGDGLQSMMMTSDLLGLIPPESSTPPSGNNSDFKYKTFECRQKNRAGIQNI